MNEPIKLFEEKLKELVTLAHKSKGVVEVERVNDFFKELNLDVSQIDKIYEYLESNNIVVLNKAEDDEDEPDEDMLLELEHDEEISLTEDFASASSIMSDDPVKLYLKEIGSYPLLSISE